MWRSPHECDCPRFAEFFELMSTSLSKNSVIPQASSTRSWISSFFDFIWDQVGLFRLPNVSTRSIRSDLKKKEKKHSVRLLQLIDYSMLYQYRVLHIVYTVFFLRSLIYLRLHKNSYCRVSWVKLVSRALLTQFCRVYFYHFLLRHHHCHVHDTPVTCACDIVIVVTSSVWD